MEHDPEARILVITDRDELDKQIEGVMKQPPWVIGRPQARPCGAASGTSRAEYVRRSSERLTAASAGLENRDGRIDVSQVGLRLGEPLFVVGNAALDFVAFVPQRRDGSDFGHGANVAPVLSDRLWRLRHNTGNLSQAASEQNTTSPKVGTQYAA